MGERPETLPGKSSDDPEGSRCASLSPRGLGFGVNMAAMRERQYRHKRSRSRRVREPWCKVQCKGKQVGTLHVLQVTLLTPHPSRLSWGGGEQTALQVLQGANRLTGISRLEEYCSTWDSGTALPPRAAAAHAPRGPQQPLVSETHVTFVCSSLGLKLYDERCQAREVRVTAVFHVGPVFVRHRGTLCLLPTLWHRSWNWSWR